MAKPDIVLEIIHVQHQPPYAILINRVADYKHEQSNNFQQYKLRQLLHSSCILNARAEHKNWKENNIHYPQLISHRILLIVQSQPLHPRQRGRIHNGEGIVGHQPCILIERQSANLHEQMKSHQLCPIFLTTLTKHNHP